MAPPAPASRGRLAVIHGAGSAGRPCPAGATAPCHLPQPRHDAHRRPRHATAHRAITVFGAITPIPPPRPYHATAPKTAAPRHRPPRDHRLRRYHARPATTPLPRHHAHDRPHHATAHRATAPTTARTTQPPTEPPPPTPRSPPKPPSPPDRDTHPLPGWLASQPGRGLALARRSQTGTSRTGTSGRAVARRWREAGRAENLTTRMAPPRVPSAPVGSAGKPHDADGAAGAGRTPRLAPPSRLTTRMAPRNRARPRSLARAGRA